MVARVKRLLTDGWIVAMDAAGTELPSGWLLLEDGLVASCGDGPAPEADEVVRRGADGDRVQIAVAPCSPFSVTRRLLEESAGLARRLGLRLHTHLAETVEEEAYCRELYGCTPVEYLDELGWIEGDVWCAHCVHLSD